MTRVPRRHGDRHGESKGTSTKISDLKVALRFSGVNFVSLNFIDYVSMALCMGDNRVGDTSGQLAMPQEMGLARRGFTSGTSSPS